MKVLSKNDKSLIIKIIIICQLIFWLCKMLPDNNNNSITLPYVVMITAYIMSIVLLVLLLIISSKRICAMALSICWVILFCITLNSFWSYYQYTKINNEIQNEYITYREETKDFYKERISLLKELGATIELSQYTENIDNLKPFEYISMGYNIQSVELLKGLVDELSYLSSVKNGTEISNDLLRIKDISKSYTGIISNSKFNLVNYVCNNAEVDITLDNYFDKVKQLINYDIYNDVTYIDKVNAMKKYYLDAKMAIPVSITFILYTIMVFVISNTWITREDKNESIKR